MEQQEQVRNNLPELFSNTSGSLIKNGNVYEMSIFKGNLTNQTIIECTRKIKIAFPNLSVQFYDILFERIKDKQFNDERLIAAVNHVIDTCTYPNPAVAQFLSFDKHIELLDYTEYCNFSTENGNKGNRFYRAVKIEGYNRPMYAKIQDIEKYKLNLWKYDTKQNG